MGSHIMVRHLSEIHQPRPWLQPISRVYDINRISGEFFYKPMVDYIDWKQSSGVEFLPTELQRKKVTLPSALEVSKADISCLSYGCPRFLPFLSKYGAQQIKENNTRKAHLEIAPLPIIPNHNM